MKIATWNVNSLKVRLAHLQDWLARECPDIVCLQETKTEDGKFSAAELEQCGFRCAYSGQAAYNGVAILSRAPPSQVQIGIPNYDDPQRRVIAASYGDVRIVCVYVPNGESPASPKYEYKLAWLERLAAWLAGELVAYPRIAVLGDFNVAPEERDVYDPIALRDQILFSAPERAAFKRLLALGLVDSFRLFEQPERSFTWWDYRMNMFKRKRGLRIDHILLSPALAQACRACIIDREMRARERPSDHAPVIAELAF